MPPLFYRSALWYMSNFLTGIRRRIFPDERVHVDPSWFSRVYAYIISVYAYIISAYACVRTGHMEIPWEELTNEALTGVIEEFVTRCRYPPG